ncbi:MAG: YggS family pyridoxal phosphate-dependent enzyme [Bacteroidota bacterium]|nr:YggS family pyridoxal phosphate-dependent enzyme [Bacteroidota bacterium]MDP4218725.1 YggS family pyridoxal phosphate-dependent enzyme [Bacteroidota bacterium]MDP4245847.1 YggS family pyridoxal phosphate-dependent enzyme [Bacteroidota bacterium]MDP4255248.1 YggS family pyridoxal phosphate-dependent enzyme [Bacteroidota bacterium]MDP4257393.1 YggS family pyridoxal phosphate-dependent enzyme [Bacteroidota bacterium]
MAIDRTTYNSFLSELGTGVTLVAVSKTKPPEDIRHLYDLGQRDFGENYVQELTDKQAGLPRDIRWHFIGHLQSNKVKAIAPFVHLIHSIDSLRLLKEVDKQAARCGRIIDCLLQVHIAREETKFGFDASELEQLLTPSPAPATNPSPALSVLSHVRVIGLMGMASFTGDEALITAEFRSLKASWDKYFGALPSAVLSMGMSGDYRIAIREGSNMIRIGSLLFGARESR